MECLTKREPIGQKRFYYIVAKAKLKSTVKCYSPAKRERKISLQGTGSIEKKLSSSIELMKIKNKSHLYQQKE